MRERYLGCSCFVGFFFTFWQVGPPSLQSPSYFHVVVGVLQLWSLLNELGTVVLAVKSRNTLEKRKKAVNPRSRTGSSLALTFGINKGVSLARSLIFNTFLFSFQSDTDCSPSFKFKNHN